MKAKIMTVLLLVAAIAWSCTNAQTPTDNNSVDSTATEISTEGEGEEEEIFAYGDHCDDEEPEVIPVQFLGEKPTIVDFARAYISSDDRGDNYVQLNEALKRYDKGQKPTKGDLTVDLPNGYICFNGNWPDIYGDMEKGTVEMCVWNCKDGRKLFVTNVKTIKGTHYDWYYEPLCYLYDSETHSMVFTILPDLGAFIEAPELAWPQRHIEGDAMSQHWPIYTLPRTGKNMKVTIADTTIPASQHRTCELVWNGNGFDKKFDK
ncbi:MAG: hypothetical protein IKG96_00230 [Bacteroidaceae bacterium]|nr:hypothetical protein [Bacteroidaceae bacterium]